MIITDYGIPVTTLHSTVWTNNYSVANNAGGRIIVRHSDQYSVFLQPGEDSNKLDDELDNLPETDCDTDLRNVDNVLSAYDTVMTNDESVRSSSDGGLVYLL